MKYNHKYTFLINQDAVIRGGHDLDSQECMILDFLVHFASSPKAERKMHGGLIFVWTTKTLILQQIPMLRTWCSTEAKMKTWKPDTLQRRLKSLRERGYIEQEFDGFKNWTAILPRAFELYGHAPTQEEQVEFQRLDTLGDISDRHPETPTPIGDLSERVSEGFPTDKTTKEIKEKETLQRKESEVGALNEQPKPIESPTSPKEVPAPPTSCPPPPNVTINREAGTITGWGVTLTRQEVGAIGRIPAEPDFYWWFNLYGKNQQQMRAETQWMLKVANWPQIAWHTVLYVTCTSPEFRKRPDAYLHDNVFLDDIDDRRPKPKPQDIKAEQDAPLHNFNNDLKFGGQD